MNILVVNDDGIKAIGIKILATALLKYGNVYVVAPDRPRSAASHKVILHKPLSFEAVDEIDGAICYKTSGMPADCVRLATGILDVKFDLVFSGVNNGLNLGTDVIYSGTVAGAREALIEGIPSVAVSTDFDSFDIVNAEIKDVLAKVFDEKLYSSEYILNINFPTKKFDESVGYKVCRQGVKIFDTKFKKNADGLYDVKSEEEIHDQNPDTDVYLADSGYITLVPLGFDNTNYKEINNLNNKI